jgi:hypothetical protein
MSDDKYQEFPKSKYHNDGRSKVVQNAEEEKALGAGWGDKPTDSVSDSTNTSQFFVFMELRVKPHWERWGWILVAVSVILAVIGGILKLSR